jgi:hypothetical protein
MVSVFLLSAERRMSPSTANAQQLCSQQIQNAAYCTMRNTDANTTVVHCCFGLQIVPALTASELAAMNSGSGSPPLQQPPVEVKCIVFEYKRLTTAPLGRAAAITTEAAAAVPVAPPAAPAMAAEVSSSIGEGDNAYTFREVQVPHSPSNSSSGKSIAATSSSSSSSDANSSSRRQVLQSAANVARQDILLVYTGAAAARSFNDEYVRASMVNVLAITNKVSC